MYSTIFYDYSTLSEVGVIISLTDIIMPRVILQNYVL
jgi:hypothetical protein